MANEIEYKVGQVLLYVPNYSNYKPIEVTVTAVGRIYAKLSNGYRVAKNSTAVEFTQNGYSSPGTLYVSREAYEAELTREKVWHAFQRAVQYVSAPKDTSADSIRHCADILGVTLKD